MKTKKFTTTQLAILGLMTAILLIMAYTPLGYLNIGPLAISFNVISGCYLCNCVRTDGWGNCRSYLWTD